MKFRALRADEIECRIGTVKQPIEAKDGKKGNMGGVSLLLYKDARCDMNVLDETVGEMNWQKSYSRENRNCTVSIWDEAKGQWVSKEDTGTESNTEAKKGLASDSFKRACFNWGIGRELYTAPFIWVSGANKYDRFWVSKMEVDEHKITALTISKCDKYGNRTDEIAYEYPRTNRKKKANIVPRDPLNSEGAPPVQEEPLDNDATQINPEDELDDIHKKALDAEVRAHGITPRELMIYYKIRSPKELTYQFEHDVMANIDEIAKEIIAKRQESA